MADFGGADPADASLAGRGSQELIRRALFGLLGRAAASPDALDADGRVIGAPAKRPLAGTTGSAFGGLPVTRPGALAGELAPIAKPTAVETSVPQGGMAPGGVTVPPSGTMPLPQGGMAPGGVTVPPSGTVPPAAMAAALAETPKPAAVGAVATNGAEARPALERYREFEANTPMPARESPKPLKGWQNALGTAATIAADIVAPRAAGMIASRATNAGRQAAAESAYDLAIEQRAAEAGELAKAADTENAVAKAAGGAAGTPAKKIDEYTSADGRRIEVMQAADGTITERVGGQERPAARKTPQTLEQAYGSAVEDWAQAQAAGDAPTAAKQQALADFYSQQIQKLKGGTGLKTGSLDPALVGLLGAPPATGTPGAAAYWQRYRQMEQQGKELGSFANAWVRQASLYYDPTTNELIRGTRLAPPAGHPNAVPAGAGELTKAVQARGLINDLAMATDKSSAALAKLDRPFSAVQAAQLKAALSNPNSIAGAAAIQAAMGTLDEPQQEYVRQLQALYEASMSMRNLLGGGRMFEIQANAMQNALPGPTAPSAAYAQGQLKRFRDTLGALEAGVPHFAGQENLIPATGPAAPGKPLKNPYR